MQAARPDRLRWRVGRAAFSDDEWHGEQRGRYLKELQRDVAEARAEVERLSTPP